MNPLYTVKKNSDFRRMYAKGKSAVLPTMVVYCRKNRLGRNRTGYTASAKLGHAVVRNRLRRQFREIYRLNAEKLLTGYDLIIVARGRAVSTDYGKMEKDFLKACAQLKLLIEDHAQNPVKNPVKDQIEEKKNAEKQNTESPNSVTETCEKPEEEKRLPADGATE